MASETKLNALLVCIIFGLTVALTFSIFLNYGAIQSQQEVIDKHNECAEELRGYTEHGREKTEQFQFSGESFGTYWGNASSDLNSD